MSDLVSQNVNMIFKSPKGETVHALKDYAAVVDTSFLP